MNIVAKTVQAFPHTTLAVLGLAGAALTVQTVRLQLSQLTTYQITRAAEDLGLDTQIIAKMTSHGPYYKGE